MKTQDDIDDLKAKVICFDCVGEDFLKTEIERSGAIAECSYCGENHKSFTIAAMSERIADMFKAHYRRTSTTPNYLQEMMQRDKESDYDWERDGEPVVYAIGEAAQIREQAAHDIQAILEDEYGDFDASMSGVETEFSSESHYAEKRSSIHAWHREWNEFERSLKTEARFFSQTAAQHLVSVFAGIETLRTTNNVSPIVDAGPGTQITEFYRARAFQSDAKLVEAMGRPDRDLGSAPAQLSGAGRMNAKGISVFYGASTDKVALAEVRPPVGSKTLVGRFQVIRPLRLLDLTALRAIMESGSLFDPGFGRRLERAMFLKYLSEKMTEPVMPDDEAFEYLPTQAIADFLATRTEPVIDGILFPSVQGEEGDQNVVLFHKAARVEMIDLPKDMQITGKTYQEYVEGVEVEYAVIEWLAPEKKEGDPLPGFPNFGGLPGPWIEPNLDGRGPALRVDLKSLFVHHVDSVNYRTNDFRVDRSRHQRTENGF